MALPGPLAELWTQWNELREAEAAPLRVLLLGPAGPAREALRRWLSARSPNPTALLVAPEAGPWPESDLQLLVLEGEASLAPEAMARLSREHRDQLTVALVGPLTQGQARRPRLAEDLQVPQARILLADDLSLLGERLASRWLEAFGQHRIRLGRQFPALRAEAASKEIHATAQQNALVGAMPIPGADLPVMTANQVKLVLRLATLHDQHLGMDRLPEVLATLGGGVALRGLARQVAKFVPGPGWLIAGAMGYSGTLAVGKAAQAYFTREARPPQALGAIDATATPLDPEP